MSIERRPLTQLPRLPTVVTKALIGIDLFSNTAMTFEPERNFRLKYRADGGHAFKTAAGAYCKNGAIHLVVGGKWSYSNYPNKFKYAKSELKPISNLPF